MNESMVDLRNQRVLVTGASGFIGAHLCRRLGQVGAQVHAVSRNPQTFSSSDWSWWQGDLSDYHTVRELVGKVKPDRIFHLAGPAVGSRDRSLVMPMFRDHLMSTVNLLNAAMEAGCGRIVITGSMDEPDPRDHRAIPSSPNVAAKWAGSAYARMFHALYQVPVVLLRVFMVYGTHQYDDTKLVPSVILSLFKGQPPKLTSGERKVDWIYVEDVIEGILAGGTVPKIEGQTIDIGTGKTTTIRDLTEYLVHSINPSIYPEYGAIQDRPLEQERYANVALAKKLLHWQPKVFLEEGLDKTIAWYRER